MIHQNFSLILEEEFCDKDINRNFRTDITFENHEKIIFGIEWALIQLVGNTLLWGMIQFDRFGSDPMKRRIIDQVKLFLTSKIANLYFLTLFDVHISALHNWMYPQHGCWKSSA